MHYDIQKVERGYIVTDRPHHNTSRVAKLWAHTTLQEALETLGALLSGSKSVDRLIQEGDWSGE